MEANLFQRNEELPVHRFKAQIRRKQREHIKKGIMDKFHQQQAIVSSLQKIEHIVFENIDFIKFVDCGRAQNFNREEERTIIMDHRTAEYQKMDLTELIILMSQLNFCLNQFPSDELQELISPHNDQTQIDKSQLCQKDPELLFQLKKLVMFLIPHICFIVKQLALCRQNLQQSQLRNFIKNHKGVNLYKLKQVTISILLQLSNISQLGCLYIFPNPSSNFEQYFFDKYLSYQPAQLILEYISGYLYATQFWYHCMLAMSNVLSIQLDNDLNDESKHLRQIFCDINFDHIVSFKLSFVSKRYESFKQNLKSGCETNQQQRSEETEKKQKILIHFVKVYIKWNESLDYEIDLFLINQIEKYIYNYMTYIVHLSHSLGQNNFLQNNRNVVVDDFGWKIIRQISESLEYLKMKMDNAFIINILLPIIRSHWERPEIAKIWKNITYNNDYKIPLLIGISDKQVHIYSYQDSITVKPHKIDHSDSQHDQTAHFAVNEVSPIKPIFQEILNTIVQTQKYRVTNKRDKDLMEGLFHVMLEMEPNEACELWEQVYERNESLKFQLEKVENVKVMLEDIEDFVMKMKEN